MIDYASDYSDYWARPDRFGSHSFSDPYTIVRQILDACGPGSLLDVGSGMGLLVQTLLGLGVDARGIDVAQRVVDAGNERLPGRFQVGSILSLPFPDDSFDTIISTDCLEHIAPEDVPQALRELARVTRRSVFLRIATIIDRDSRWHTTIQKRDWWEQQLFDAGFRKHPNYYRINSYESLEHDPWQITIVMEKVPKSAIAMESQAGWPGVNQRGSDPLRVTGRQSDAELIRYQLAGQFVRPGDTVLELACGTGAGLHVLRHNSPAARLIGLETSVPLSEYGRANFGDSSQALDISSGAGGSLRERLAASIPDHAVDVVIAFNLLNRDRESAWLVPEIARVLIPGGRVIVAVPAEDSAIANPSAFSLKELQEALAPHLLLESLYQQHVDPAPDSSSDRDQGGRWLRQASWSWEPQICAQWWIATAIRDPLIASNVPYRETVFANLETAEHPSTQYTQYYCNPWIVHSMVHVGYRVKSPALLSQLAERLLADSPPDSADFGAALCILAYRLHAASSSTAEAAQSLISQILPYLQLRSENLHVLRWQISLSFVLAQLHLKIGSITEARKFFRACSELDPFRFSVHLATKTAEAFFWWGWLALNQHDLAEAEEAWAQGVSFGKRLLSQPLDHVLMNPADPNIFDHGDGMREYVHAAESITKCTNGLHLLNRQREGRIVNWSDVHKTFRSWGEQLGRGLQDAQNQAAVLTTELHDTRRELVTRTSEVDAARESLIARTAEVDVARQELIARTADLDSVRNELLARTIELDSARHESLVLIADLEATRKDLIGRTVEVDAARQDLIARTAELDAARAALQNRWRGFRRGRAP